MRQEQGIDKLNRAGLTLLQAKIYLALFQNGKQTVKTLSEIASIDRANAYREILKLQKIGLIIRIIGIPNLYEALPIDRAIPLLLSYKKEEYEETKKEAEDLLRKYKYPLMASFEKLDARFIMIPKKNAFLESAKRNIESAQITNDTISNLKRFSQALGDTLDLHKSALKRGVRTRVIVEKPRDEKSIGRALCDLMEYPDFEMRCTPNLPQVLGACFDGKIVAILIDPLASVQESPCLTTDHSSFVKLFQNYFNDLWDSGKPIPKFALVKRR